jgi:hypothetical protein
VNNKRPMTDLQQSNTRHVEQGNHKGEKRDGDDEGGFSILFAFGYRFRDFSNNCRIAICREEKWRVTLNTCEERALITIMMVWETSREFGSRVCNTLETRFTAMNKGVEHQTKQRIFRPLPKKKKKKKKEEVDAQVTVAQTRMVP